MRCCYGVDWVEWVRLRLDWVKLRWVEMGWVELRWVRLGWVKLSWDVVTVLIGLNELDWVEFFEWVRLGLGWVFSNELDWVKLCWVEMLLWCWLGFSNELDWVEFFKWVRLS